MHTNIKLTVMIIVFSAQFGALNRFLLLCLHFPIMSRICQHPKLTLSHTHQPPYAPHLQSRTWDTGSAVSTVRRHRLGGPCEDVGPSVDSRHGSLRKPQVLADSSRRNPSFPR